MYKQTIFNGYRVASYIEEFPKALLPELNTHRQLVRNTASTRAVSLSKQINKVEAQDNFWQWSGKKRGMTGASIPEEISTRATEIFNELKALTCEKVRELEALGIHKQHAGRFLTAFELIPVILSGTEFPYFFSLRTGESVQPEFREYAIKLQNYWNNSPWEKSKVHLPWGSTGDLNQDLIFNVGRSAVISYSNHDGSSTLETFTRIVDKLYTEHHATPFEHVFFAGEFPNTRQYKGWYSLRSALEDGEITWDGSKFSGNLLLQYK